MQLFMCQTFLENGDLVMTKWISVKERLPKDGRYLVCEKSIPPWIGVCSLRNGKWDIDISHYMSLPNPPEKENEP